MAHACFSLLPMTTVLTVSGATRRWREGESPLPFVENRKKVPWFCKKSVLILQKSVLFVCIYGSNSYLKCSSKIILEKKYQNISLLGLSFVGRPLNIYRSAPISRNLPCLEKFLVTCLRPESQVRLCLIFHKACSATFHLINSG